MPHLHDKPLVELINVHRVLGDKEAIIFLKNADHDFVEGLFYTAKRYGRSEFDFRGLKYDVVRNKDTSFTVRLSEEQNISTEQYA